MNLFAKYASLLIVTFFGSLLGWFLHNSSTPNAATFFKEMQSLQAPKPNVVAPRGGHNTQTTRESLLGRGPMDTLVKGSLLQVDGSDEKTIR